MKEHRTGTPAFALSKATWNSRNSPKNSPLPKLLDLHPPIEKVLYQALIDARSLCRASPKDGRQAGRLRQQCDKLPEAQSLLNQTVKRSIESYAGLTDQRPAVKAQDMEMTGRAARFMTDYNTRN